MINSNERLHSVMVIFLHVSVGCLISFDGILEFGVCAHLEGHTTLTSVSR